MIQVVMSLILRFEEIPSFELDFSFENLEKQKKKKKKGKLGW